MKHYFRTAVASEVGVNAAIVFENISYWIEHNRKKGQNEREGTFWMFSTQNDLAAQFEYFSVKQTRTAIDKLIEADYLKTGCFNRHGYDRTRWFALGEKGESIIHEGQNDLPEKAEGETGGAKVIDLPGLTIPNKKNTDIKEDLKNRMRALAKECGAVCNI